MKIVTGSFQNPDGTPVSLGRVFFTLSQDAFASGTQVSSSSSPISFNLDTNGHFSAEMFANDELTPSGTFYLVAVLAAGGGLVWQSVNMSLTGSSPINLNSITP